MQGRIRSIKPEVHTDDELWDLEQETGFPIFRAFTGLWNYADREGRFKWRPRQLKAVILPYWEGDFSRVMDALVTRGFLVKYRVTGRDYGLVRTFKEHQQINGREAPSVLPGPDDDASSTREPRVTAPVTDAIRTEQKGVDQNRTERSARDPAPALSLDFTIRLAYRKRYEAAFDRLPSEGDAFGRSLKTFVAWLLAEQERTGEDPEQLGGRVLDGLFASEKALEKHCPLSWVATDPCEFLPSNREPDVVPPHMVEL